MLPFSRPSCLSKTRPPSCALGTSFYTVSEGSDLMKYVSDNYTSYSAHSRLRPSTSATSSTTSDTTGKNVFVFTQQGNFPYIGELMSTESNEFSLGLH